MIRIPDEVRGLGQARVQNNINQYSWAQDFYDAGIRPDLGPTDEIPMAVKTAWENPGEAKLRKEQEIVPLTPVGARSTDVYPGVNPAPDDTQDITYEDRIPRLQYRADQVLRSRSGYRGPGQYWKYGGMSGPSEGNPILFNFDPSEVAYQTYPGPMLGQTATPLSASCSPKRQALTSSMLLALGVGTAYGANFFKDRDLRQALIILGVIVGGIGGVSLVGSVGEYLSTDQK